MVTPAVRTVLFGQYRPEARAIFAAMTTPPTSSWRNLVNQRVKALLSAGDRPYYAGYINLGTPVDLGSTLYVRQDGITAQFTSPDGSLYGYLVTNGAYTPTALSVYRYGLHGVRA